MITIRPEQQSDAASIGVILRQAFLEEFGSSAEAELVERLRDSCPALIGLVAELEGRLVGHILFSPVVVESDDEQVTGMGLAPMAVLPKFQRQGIGSQLVRAGLETIRMADHPFVLVLGHPEYYPRFGFERASRYGITCEFTGVPDEAFMIHLFGRSRLTGGRAVARYRPEFSSVTGDDRPSSAE